MCPRGRFRAWGVKFLSMSLTPGACEAVPACSSGRSSRQTDITRSKPWSGCGGLTGSTSLKYSEPGDRQMFDGMPLQRVAALAPPLWARSDGRRPGARASTVHEGGEEYHADHCTDFGRQVPPESSSSSLPAGGGKWSEVDPLRFCRLGAAVHCRLQIAVQVQVQGAGCSRNPKCTNQSECEGH